MRISGHSVYISVPLIYSIRLIPFISADLARLDFYWLKLNWAFLLSFLTKMAVPFLRNEMQKSNNDSVQTCAQEPETTAVPRLAHNKKFECIMIFKDDEWPYRKMTISEEIGILNCLLPTMVT